MNTTLDNWLQAELERLDVLLQREILRLRGRYQLSLDEFRGLYVSDRQVDALVGGSCAPHENVDEMTRAAEQMRQSNAAAMPPEWKLMKSEFGLSNFELDVLLIAIAREIHLKYETIYAYLHDDVTRKKPTSQLALRLAVDADRNRLLPEATLFKDGLLHPIAETRFLGAELIATLPVLRHLTGLAAESSIPQTGWPHSSACDVFRRAGCMKSLLVIESADFGFAQAMVEAACAESQRRLVTIDAGRQDLTKLASRIRLLQRLENCAICLIGTQKLWGDGVSEEVRQFSADLTGARGPVWLIVGKDSAWRSALPLQDVRLLPLPEPDYSERTVLWRRVLPQSDSSLHERLAASFSLGTGQIQASATYAVDLLQLHGEKRPPEWKDMVDAVRSQSAASLGRLAQRLPCRQNWDDLVLPPATMRQVREVAAAIRFHQVVYSDWGFGRKHTALEGLKILFAGPSGTGKTMTAGVVGNDLGLDVYRVDLSGIVSKYIGETEKNLDRVFRAARGSNGLLFFDEADALFGKRSEVRDAHDRYANIEVAYLLQKLEEHDAPVILATNLRRNIDEAFSRRLHYAIEFSPPDEEHRLLLWQKVFPALAPLSDDIDFGFLAAQFPVSGGDIKNVALDAAFLAVQEKGVVMMKHLAAAMARQVLKQGRVPTAVQFQKYFAVATRA